MTKKNSCTARFDNLSSWEGCPATGENGEFDSMPHIVCAYSQSTAFRKLVPFIDDNGEVVYIQKIYVQSGDVGPPSDSPEADENNPLWNTSMMQMVYLKKVADLPSASPEMD